MSKRCGLRSGQCRKEGSCPYPTSGFPDPMEWHLLAAKAADCLYYVGPDPDVWIRGRVAHIGYKLKRRIYQKRKLL